MTVIGSTPIPQYPAGPAWTQQDQSVEPPLGVEIDAQEAVGTAQEIQASLDDAERANADCHQLINGNSAPAPASSRDGGASAASSLRLRRPQLSDHKESK
jgi:hypothetical protein